MVLKGIAWGVVRLVGELIGEGLEGLDGGYFAFSWFDGFLREILREI